MYGKERLIDNHNISVGSRLVKGRQCYKYHIARCLPGKGSTMLLVLYRVFCKTGKGSTML